MSHVSGDDETRLIEHSYSGIATHYLHSSSLPDLEARLSELQFRDTDNLQQRLKLVDTTIEEFNTGLPHDQPISAPIAGRIRSAIDYIFQDLHSYEDIIKALDEAAAAQDAAVSEWATKTKKTILQRSPTSIRVTMKQLRDGRKWSILETFRKEHSIAAHFMRHPDFVEGVSSLLIRKPKTTPEWKPASVSQVSGKAVDAFFTAHQPGFQPLRTGPESDYKEYPHAWTGLPSEKQVQTYVEKLGNKDAVMERILSEKSHKQGVKEKVTEILARKTEPTTDGQGLKWKDA